MKAATNPMLQSLKKHNKIGVHSSMYLLKLSCSW